MLYGGTTKTGAKDPLSVAANGVTGLQVFDLNTNKWYAPTTANAPTAGPVLPACGAASGNIWVYSSQYGMPGKASTAVSLLDSVHWSWSSPTEQGQLPVTRFGAASAFADSTQSFYIHGGIPLNDDTNTAGSTPGIANNMDILQPSGLTWTYTSNGPARKYHTLCYMSSIDSLILFGGSDQNIASYNDVKTFSVKSNGWQYSVNVAGTAPAERILHSAVCTADSMYVFGGTHSANDDPSDSVVWVLKANGPTNFTWSKAPISSSAQGIGPTARSGHSAALHGNNMYIYGGVGPSGQDGTMYKLDLDKWQWSRTDVLGSGVETQKEHKTKTAVLVAAIVCAVLGIVTICIAATVIYRCVRRRHARFFDTARRHSTAPSDASSEEDGAGNAGVLPMGELKRSSSVLYPDHAADMYRRDSAANTENLPMSWPATQSHSSIAFAPLPPMVSADYVSGRSGSGARTPAEEISAATTPATIAAELLPTTPKGAVPNNPGGMLKTMRAHARSLSTRIGSSRLSMAFSDTASHTSAAAAKSSSSVRPKRAVTSSTPMMAHQNLQSPSATAVNRSAVVNMYGPDQARLEGEYRHAEAINQILLSGQPIPAWLRDAVNQAQIGGESNNDHEALEEAVSSARILGIANRSESRQPGR
ncbi:hypothetical protein H4S07_003898 [Coemansia furcata]|uniref:Uncharacterized protein n=1 Tax=Coemansia furcata TaxID=417177 RepID=A0ACC1LEF3_9FUNG|nr:hypothetical protein H4S07_003898 [Coemansia furcata]